MAVRPRAGKPIPACVLLAALAICFSYAISSTLSATDRSGSVPPQKGSVVQLNLGYFDLRDPPGGALTESLWEQLDEPARRAALEILARLIARMLVAAANEASHE